MLSVKNIHGNVGEFHLRQLLYHGERNLLRGLRRILVDIAHVAVRVAAVGHDDRPVKCSSCHYLSVSPR